MIRDLFALNRHRIVQRLAILAGLLLLVSYAAGMLLPVYTDEIGWRQVHRAALDGGFDMEGSDICGPNTLARPPWFMMPVRWFSAVTNLALASPGLVRLTGVVCAVTWVILLWRLIARLFPDSATRNRQVAVAASLLGLGLLPFLMVMSRPEQPILLASVLVVLIALAPPAERPGAAWLRAAAMLALAAVMVSYHPKGVAYAGIPLVGIFVSARGRATLLPRALSMAALIAMAGVAFRYWALRFACPGDPELAALIARSNVAGLIARGGGHLDLVFQLLTGLNPATYVALAIPDNWPMSQWLPNWLFTERTALWLGRGMKAAWILPILLTQLHVLRLLLTRGPGLLREPRFLLGAGIAGCVIVWGCSQIERNVYEAAHMLPMMLLAVLVLKSIPSQEPPAWERIERGLPWVLVPFAVFSQVFVLKHVLPALIAAWHTPGYLSAQPYSTAVTGYAAITRDIDRAMAQAGFPTDRRLRHLLIDSLTYLHLQRSFQPFERVAVLGPMKGQITDPMAYLRSRGSDGVVVGCQFLPPDMLRLASRSGQICALRLAGPES